MNVDVTAPAAAPARTDLPFLRRRVAPGRARKPQPADPRTPSSLDLSPNEPTARPQLVRRSPYRAPLVSSGDRTVLAAATPMVTLNRVRSGVGLLMFDAVWSAATTGIRLGCAYALVGGHSSTVQCGGIHSGPMNSRNPIILARQHRSGRLTVDLRQSGRLERMIVFSSTEQGHRSPRDGNLVVTTFGGARIELPVDGVEPGSVVVHSSVYRVDGEFVIRAELSSLTGSVRDACAAYGFDRITWLDSSTPAH